MNQPASVHQLRAAKLFTIGQVLTVLTAEFSDLTQSKLRFLEDHGLITPQRTDAGYRKFTELDIDRLRIILELQRDHYLPLKVIGNYLNELDQGKQPQLPGANSINPAHIRLAKGKRLSKIELIAETAITASLIVEAQELGLIADEPFESSDVEIARAIVQLQRFGLAPRHLRGLKASADREIGIIQGVVAPVVKKQDASSRSRASHFATEIQSQFNAIRNELIRAVISKIDD